MACRPTKKVCFGCLKIFNEDDAEYCHNCTEWKCPLCGICGCLVEEETLKAIRAITKTYELWLDRKKVVYLAGAINGCTDSEANDWRVLAKKMLKDFDTLDPMVRDYRGRENECVNEIVELDKKDIDNSNIILCSYEKPSVGTSMEILYAWEHKKPVFVFTIATTISPWMRYHAYGIYGSLEQAIIAIGESCKA